MPNQPDPHVGPYTKGGGAIWFKHRYRVVTDMFGRARYECICRGRHSVGPWRKTKDLHFAKDWADQDGDDHIRTGSYG